jgi:hypothetical protein
MLARLLEHYNTYCIFNTDPHTAHTANMTYHNVLKSCGSYLHSSVQSMIRIVYSLVLNAASLL